MRPRLPPVPPPSAVWSRAVRPKTADLRTRAITVITAASTSAIAIAIATDFAIFHRLRLLNLTVQHSGPQPH